jgi:hypothetical protein
MPRQKVEIRKEDANYGSLDEPEILLSSDTRSDSLLSTAKIKKVRKPSDEGGS